jgi:hypothetical protein
MGAIFAALPARSARPAPARIMPISGQRGAAPGNARRGALTEREPPAISGVCVGLPWRWARLMDDLDSRTYPIQEDMKFQRRMWLAERIGWIVMGVLLIAALTGFFFHGPVSRATATSSDNAVSVGYERFAHKTARTYFTIRVNTPLSREVLVRLGPSFVAIHDIEIMEPMPIRSSSGSQGLELVFAPSSTADLAIHIAMRPKQAGIMRTQVEIEGSGVLKIAQLIYP